jgi:hypothetical protein
VPPGHRRPQGGRLCHGHIIALPAARHHGGARVTWLDALGAWSGMARSSTCCCRPGATWPPPGASSPGRCRRAWFRSRCRRTVRPPTRESSTNWFPRPCTLLSGRHANNLIEADHGWLKARLGPMRGLKRYRSARILAAGHAFVQNLRRGHYEIATETRALTGSASPSTTPPSPSEPARRCGDAPAYQGKAQRNSAIQGYLSWGIIFRH